MKITEAAIKLFESDDREYGTKAAIDTFVASIADDIDKHFRFSQRDFARDAKDSGTKIALSNLQWQITSRLLTECGCKSIKTTYRKK